MTTNKIHKRPPNPAVEEYRKTIFATQFADAVLGDDLAVAALNAFELLCTLADAGVFGLALDLPAGVDPDHDMANLNAALRERGKNAPATLTDDQRAARDALSAKLSDTAARVDDKLNRPASTTLVGAATRLVYLMAPRVSPYASPDLGTQVLRRLDGLADALAAEVDAADAAEVNNPGGWINAEVGTPIRPALSCATVVHAGGDRPAGYVSVFDSAGFCGSRVLLTDAEVTEFAGALRAAEGTLIVRAVDYAVEPGTRLCVALYDVEGKLVLHGPAEAEAGPRSLTGVDLRERLRTLPDEAHRG